MGLSSFNAMRARMKAEANALENSGAKVEVKETEPAEKVEVSEPIVAETVDKTETATKKTDAEKLKKKKKE